MANKKSISRRGDTINLSTGKTVGNKYALGDVLKKIDGALEKASPYLNEGLGALTTAAGIYNVNSQVGSTQAYDTKLSQLDDSISVGNFDALADWRASVPVYDTDLNAEDFDNGMTGGQRFANVAFGALSGLASGKGLLGKAVNVASAIGAGLLARGKRKREQERLAKEYNEKNLLANAKADAMYRHEFNDITEEMKNQALANINAAGGSIDIAPSKKGTFKAQATRMGMSVSEAADHILAHKDRYSKEMVKKAAFANAFAHAYGGKLLEDGGPMFNYPTEYTHGGYFATSPELIEINQGGTHESNPLDGVPMGFDENGVPNLVEEGETIYDDYVFSNRLSPTEDQLIEAGLPTKYKDHTFAYISSKIAEQFKETPNDEIANESLKEYMQRLKTVQEQTKQDKEAEEQVEAANQFASLPPEQQEAVMQQAQDQQEIDAMQQPQEEAIPQEEAMPQDVPAGMEMYGNQPVDMMAYGGNLFALGDDLGNDNKYLIFNTATGQYEIDEGAIAADTEAQFKGRPRREVDIRIHRRMQQAQRALQKANTQKEPEPEETQTGNSEFGELSRLVRETSTPGIYEPDVDRISRIARRRALRVASEGSAAFDRTYNEAYNKLLSRAGGKAQRLTSATEVARNRRAADAYLATTGYRTAQDADAETLREYNDILRGRVTVNSDDSDVSGGGTGGGGRGAAAGTGSQRGSGVRGTRSSSAAQQAAPTAAMKDANAILTRKDRPLFYEGQAQDAARLAVEKAIPGADIDTSELESDIASYADSIRNAQETFGRRGYQRRINRGESLDQINAEAEERNERDKLLPTWMRYAPVAGAALGAIWDMAQKPDYSVAEAAESVARRTPRVRFNPIGDYMTYTPVDRNFYLNQLRNQALATDRSILQASGANQGAATAGLLASQYNTQTGLSNSLMQQELANRQNQQQVAQFNRGTNQYNSQGLFNESAYNQRAGMQRGQFALTAAQLRQAERQRRNAAISADLTNLFQGIGDIGWENMNYNMVNSTRAANSGYGYDDNNGAVSHHNKNGGMLTKKKSRRK